MTDHTDPTHAERTGEELIARVREASDALRGEIAKVIVGQEDVVDQILMAVFCDGHALLVGVPGLAKTLLVSTIARAMDLKFSRIQFTPDLMPSDITGTEVIEEDKATGRRELRFVPGPIFANVVLADEINRTPPKTQAALLESMQERQVSVGGVRHMLPEPFFVLATQNPLEQEGTYPLPEAQLDRFMFQVQIRYPTESEELEVMRRSARKDEVVIDPVIDAAAIREVRRIVRHCPVPDFVLRYALRLVRSTRGGEGAPSIIRDYLSWGAGPRASEALVHAAKAHALTRGTGVVTDADVRAVAHPVLRHRILTNFNAEADQITPDAILDALLEQIPVTGESESDRRLSDPMLRDRA
ncbi:MAG: MoxR family ATPase [Planctomycetota bacterium]|nr:MAG: MoxR family ATPase [Planctomycetota bacterium]